jgi:hypothetical protein
MVWFHTGFLPPFLIVLVLQTHNSQVVEQRMVRVCTKLKEPR